MGIEKKMESQTGDIIWIMILLIIDAILIYCLYEGLKMNREEKKNKNKQRAELKRIEEMKNDPEIRKKKVFADLIKAYPAYANSYEKHKHDPAYQAYFGLDPSTTDNIKTQSKSVNSDRTIISHPTELDEDLTESYENNDLLERLREQEEEIERLQNANNRMVEEYNNREREFQRRSQQYIAYERMQSRKYRPEKTDESYYDVYPEDLYDDVDSEDFEY